MTASVAQSYTDTARFYTVKIIDGVGRRLASWRCVFRAMARLALDARTAPESSTGRAQLFVRGRSKTRRCLL